MITIISKLGNEIVEGEEELIDISLTKKAFCWIYIENINQKEDDNRDKIFEIFNCDSRAIKDALRVNHKPKAEYFPELKQLFLILGWEKEGPTSYQGHDQNNSSYFLSKEYLIVYSEQESIKTIPQETIIKIINEKEPLDLFYEILNYLGNYYYKQVERGEFKEALKINNFNTLTRNKKKALVSDSLKKQKELRNFLLDINYHLQILPILKNHIQDLTRKELTYDHGLTDCTDKFSMAKSQAEFLYDINKDHMEAFISHTTYKQNNILSALTLVTAIFIPLSFATGLWGMNFLNLPGQSNPEGFKIFLFFSFGFVGLISVLSVINICIRWIIRKKNN